MVIKYNTGGDVVYKNLVRKSIYKLFIIRTMPINMAICT